MGKKRWLIIIVLFVLAAVITIIGIDFARESARPVVAPGLEPQAPDTVNLVAVQVRFEPASYFSEEAFRSLIRESMEQAAAETQLGRDTLVVFPEDIGLLTVLFGKKDILSEAQHLGEGIENVIQGNLLSVGYQKIRRRVSWPRALFLAHQDAMARAYFDVFSDMAREHDVYLVAGTGGFTDGVMARYVPRDVPGAPTRSEARNFSDIYNASVVFGPDGDVLGVQRKVYLIELEGPTGLDIEPAPLDRLEVIPTSLGTLGIAICLDGFRDDVLDHLSARGAQILIQPSANPGPWDPDQQEGWLMSSWRAVAEDQTFVYAINPMLAGDILDLGFFGQSSIVALPHLADEMIPQQIGYSDLTARPGFLTIADDDENFYIVHFRVPHPDSVR